MAIALAICPLVCFAGIGGTPDVAQIGSLQGRMVQYEHTISASFGFETCKITFPCTKDEALFWLNQLMASVIVYGPDAEVIWEGYLEQVDASLGQESRSLSIREMANRARVRYTTVIGTPGTTSTASGADSQALYGVKDVVVMLNESTLTAANNKRARILAERKDPVSRPAARIATGDLGESSVALTFAGWYATLDWVLTSRTDTSTETTTTQVGALIGTSSPGIGATNAFLSTSTTNILSSGISDTRYIAPDTSYRQKIEALLSQGDSSSERMAWGVYEDRKFFVTEWAGATPGTIAYQRFLGDGRIYNPVGSVVEPWDVRPDAMYQVVDLVDPGPISTAADAAMRFYVERVTCAVDENGTSLTLEPQASDSLDAILARA